VNTACGLVERHAGCSSDVLGVLTGHTGTDDLDDVVHTLLALCLRRPVMLRLESQECSPR
jgi:hypothetical protein